MEGSGLIGRIWEFLKKYRHAWLILAVGLLLMLLPSGQKKEPEPSAAEPESTMEERLSDILSQMDGVGKARVMLTQSSGEEILYQTNENSSRTETTQNRQITVVTVTGSSREEAGLVRQINPPVYLGAIVVCQGAEDPVIRLAVVNAVSRVTGLGADRISVLKMK